MFPGRLAAVGAIGVLVFGGKASADVLNMPAGQTSLQFVTVGDPGNAADPLTGFGSVAYSFQISAFDTTVAEYTAFLNAVASSDPFRLYNASMNPGNNPASCGIVQSGNPGSFTYSFASSNANLPVNAVSWGDAARFCNWLANGQPDTGVENSTTTEDGSYALNGAMTDKQLASVTRSPFATYVIPTENEWYKSAYYKGGSANAGYWLYPTQSDTPPSNVLSMTGTNNANFFDPNLGFTDPTSFLTPVGEFSGSPGPYATFDMGGDVGQWTEGLLGSQRVIRGGAYTGDFTGLESSFRSEGPPSAVALNIGFRVAEVPEPGSLFVLAVGGLGLFLRNRRR